MGNETFAPFSVEHFVQVSIEELQCTRTKELGEFDGSKEDNQSSPEVP